MSIIKDGNTVLTAYAYEAKIQNVQRSVQAALDGTTYYQVFPTIVNWQIEGAATLAEQALIETAERNGDQLTICDKSGTAIGYGHITALSFSRPWHHARVTFSMTLVGGEGSA